jgi:hypothetical protein
MVQGGKEASTLQCACGYAILCEVRRFGECLSTVAFFDDMPTSRTHGEKVESCRGCGEQLEVLTLLPKNLRT